MLLCIIFFFLAFSIVYGEFESIMINPCRAYLDCHLMVTNPLDYVEPLGKAGASGFTFHIETSKGWS
jgi:pentose-5-phosphate-3-epimerase